jgi:hypothetical protein
MLKGEVEPNRRRPSATPRYSGMSMKPWTSPQRTLIGSNAMHAGRYHAASGPSRLSWRSTICRTTKFQILAERTQIVRDKGHSGLSDLARGSGRANWQALVSWNLPQQPFEIFDGLRQSIAQLHSGRPAEQVLR